MVREDFVSGKSVTPLPHLYSGGRCLLNLATQFSVTDPGGEAGSVPSWSFSMKRKGTWAGKKITTFRNTKIY